MFETYFFISPLVIFALYALTAVFSIFLVLKKTRYAATSLGPLFSTFFLATVLSIFPPLPFMFAADGFKSESSISSIEIGELPQSIRDYRYKFTSTDPYLAEESSQEGCAIYLTPEGYKLENCKNTESLRVFRNHSLTKWTSPTTFELDDVFLVEYKGANGNIIRYDIGRSR